MWQCQHVTFENTKDRFTYLGLAAELGKRMAQVEGFLEAAPRLTLGLLGAGIGPTDVAIVVVTDPLSALRLGLLVLGLDLLCLLGFTTTPSCSATRKLLFLGL